VLLTITLMFTAFNVGNGIVMVWLPILVDRTLGGGSGLYGALLGLLSAGEVTSALLAGSITFPLSLGMLIGLAQLLSGMVLLILLPVRTVWGAAIALALFGAFSAPLTIWAQTLRMRIIPAHLRGRTFALLRTMMQGGTPFGGAAAGFLLPVLGIPAMIALSAVVVGLPGLAGLRVKELRRSVGRRDDG
jgi:MFS family permease